MKLGKKIAALVLSAALLTSFAGCANQSAESSAVLSEPQSSDAAASAQIRVGVLKGPTSLGMLQVMDNNDQKQAQNSYDFTVAGSADEIVSKIASGELDVAAVPTNLAATLYNKTKGGVQLAAVNTLGILSLVTKGEEISSVADLKGKTIYTSGQGAAPEYVLDYILTANGLTGDVKVEYLSEHSEVASQLLADKISIAVLPEPFVTQVTTKDDKVKVALDLTKEWDKAVEKLNQGSSILTMGSLVVRRDFAEKNKEAFDRFLKEYQESVDFVNQNPDKAGVMSEKYDIMPAAIAQKAIPNCNIVFLSGENMRIKTENFLKIFYEYNPKSVGGAMPKSDFYYQYPAE
jgi:NitT/TauT family transport system substrate-binding protein